jgi:hypothetical protein
MASYGSPRPPIKKIVACIFITLLCLISPTASADVADDAKGLIAQLNPINLALGPLIDRAAADGNAVLQQRLEQLNGIIQLALFSLNQIATQRMNDLDAKTRQQIAELNRYVSTNLLQFNYIVGKNLSDANAYLSQNLDKFNFGVANNIASVQFLNTVPLLNIGSSGLTTFKQQGAYTDVFLVGSGFKKFNETPEAYLQGDSIKPENSWFGKWKGVKLDIPSASMGLLQIRIPNNLIPDTPAATPFTLALSIRDGSRFFISTYSEQSLPIRICGSLPKFQMIVSTKASGKQWEYSRIPYPGATPYGGDNVIGTNCKSGNNNSHYDVCPPAVPPNGYEIDNSAPEYGVTYSSETGHNRHNVSRTASGCIHLYCEGDDGDAWENIMGVRLKLRRLVDVPQCADPISSTVNLQYGQLEQIRLDEQVSKATGVCQAAAAQATPNIRTTATIHDSAGKDVEVRDLDINVPQTALNGALTLSLGSGWLLDAKLQPSCSFQYSVASK